MPNCKPNDLAVIQGLVIYPHHNGRIVTTQSSYLESDGLWWEVLPATFDTTGAREVYNDRNLHPIRGDTSSTQKALDQHTPTHVA